MPKLLKTVIWLKGLRASEKSGLLARPASEEKS